MKKLLNVAVAAVLFSLVVLPLASASDADQVTKITFGEAVEIPGQVLPAGSYWFALVGDTFNRTMVRIYSADRKTVYATQATTDIEHFTPATDTTVRFAERGSSQPQALLEWRYPGETTGHEFLYRKAEQRELAQDQQQTIVSGTAGF
jgi:hypothetical protein